MSANQPGSTTVNGMSANQPGSSTVNGMSANLPGSSPFKGEVRSGMGSDGEEHAPIPTPALQSQTSHATFPLKGREQCADATA